ncbi:MAG: WbuC family cupin fold metalloprotein [Bacteroidales bacterium]
MKKIDSSLLKSLMVKSRQMERRRINLNFHDGSADPLQRMLNAMQPGTYLQPHKHENPDKREVFIALTGRFVVIVFDDDGLITDHMILDPVKNNPAAEIAARVYHTIICLQPDSVIYEIKDGPYDPADDKQFATWAPQEGHPLCNQFLEKWLSQININFP